MHHPPRSAQVRTARLSVPPDRQLLPTLGALMVCAGCGGGAPSPPARADLLPFPATMVWAWERPEDLTTVDPARAGVALLVGTAYLGDDEVRLERRRQPARLAPGARVLPVVRVEVERGARPRLDAEQRARLASLLGEVGARGGALQVDFEATASQRPFYRALLDDLRARLGPTRPIPITALGSWCLQDRWLAGLPVDEVVPMLYRLGPLGAEAERALSRGALPAPECRAAVGRSLDEADRLPAGPPGPRRTYHFNPRPWTPGDLLVVGADRPAAPPRPAAGRAPEPS